MQLSDIYLLKNKILANYSKKSLLGKSLFCTVHLNDKMRTRAGYADWNNNKIVLNKRLLEKYPEHIEQTLAHELAHLVAVDLYGRKAWNHGPLWKEVILNFGHRADRCHNLDTSVFKRRHKNVATVKCKCGIFGIKKKMFNKILNGSKYGCLKCKEVVKLIEE